MISPKVSFWFGVWTSVLLLVASGTVGLTNVFPHDWVPYVQGWASFLGAVNSVVLTALHGYSGATSGPLVEAPPKITPAVRP